MAERIYERIQRIRENVRRRYYCIVHLSWRTHCRSIILEEPPTSLIQVHGMTVCYASCWFLSTSSADAGCVSQAVRLSLARIRTTVPGHDQTSRLEWRSRDHTATKGGIPSGSGSADGPGTRGPRRPSAGHRVWTWTRLGGPSNPRCCCYLMVLER